MQKFLAGQQLCQDVTQTRPEGVALLRAQSLQMAASQEALESLRLSEQTKHAIQDVGKDRIGAPDRGGNSLKALRLGRRSCIEQPLTHSVKDLVHALVSGHVRL